MAFIRFPFPPERKGSEIPTGGHPTVPGDLDESFLRHGRPSPGNGMPGIPRVHTAPRHGPGIPGHTPTGPMQPGTEYNEGEDTGKI